MKTSALILFMVLAAVNTVVAQREGSTNPAKAHTDTVTLKEIVVQASRPASRLDGDGIVTTVTGTPLHGIGTVSDLLGYIPGVLNNNGSIEVIGKGVPMIYINGRRLMNMAELTQLPSSKVREIKVITNPGARYDNSIGAVIRISTVRELGEGLSLDSRTVLGYRDYIYGKEQLGLNYRNAGLDIFGTLEYDNTRSKSRGTTIQSIWGGGEKNTNELETRDHQRASLYFGKVGFNYTTRSGHSIGAYYQSVSKPVKTDGESESLYTFDETSDGRSRICRSIREKNHDNLVDGYYSGKWGSWSADAAFDFLWRDKKSNQSVIEDEVMSFIDRSDGRMLAAELHLSHPLWKGVIKTGAAYTNSFRKDKLDSRAADIPDADNRSSEDNVGIYCELEQRFGELSMRVGLRYEYIGSRYYENDVKMERQSRDYNKLLPSFSISMPWGKTMWQAAYTRKYRRPLYSQLSSTVYYDNKYTYETGNPMLKSSFSDNVSLNFIWKWLTVMGSYRHQTDKIITGCFNYPENPEVTLYKKINSPDPVHNFELITSVVPGMVGKYYYPMLMAGVVTQFYKTEYRGTVKRMNNPMTIIRLNNIFLFPGGFRATADLNYRSGGDGENVHIWQHVWNIDLSLSKTFGRHWDLRLAVNDIFNTGGKTGFTIYSSCRDIRVDGIMNTRGVEFTIGYRFNTAKSKYRGNGAGNTEKERF